MERKTPTNVKRGDEMERGRFLRLILLMLNAGGLLNSTLPPFQIPFVTGDQFIKRL